MVRGLVLIGNSVSLLLGLVLVVMWPISFRSSDSVISEPAGIQICTYQGTVRVICFPVHPELHHRLLTFGEVPAVDDFGNGFLDANTSFQKLGFSSGKAVLHSGGFQPQTTIFHFASIPIWFLFLLSMTGPTIHGRVFIRARRQKRGRCAACGYDLRATPERCPECGRVASAKRPN
jgi:hypothetical protein